MKLYICGPMSGYEDFNRPAFYALEAHLTAKEYEVLNPARVGDGAISWQANMRRAITLMMQADALVVMDGWQKSRGARTEVYLARKLEMPIYDTELHEVSVECHMAVV